uniref:Uncharacterized protein n=1 Tax=Kalanchoe fedtschenkoi TaxID=63787 RepID=A0A7N0UUW4_KALFE
MKVLAAFLLAVLGDTAAPSAADLKKILGSVGAEADKDRIELLLSEVKGKIYLQPSLIITAQLLSSFTRSRDHNPKP